MHFWKKLKVLTAVLLPMVALQPLSATPQEQACGTGEKLLLTVESAVEMALDQNLSVKVADEEVRRVDWLKKENWYALLPSLSGSIQYSNHILKPVFFSDFFPGGKMEVGSTHSYMLSSTMELPILAMPLFKSIHLSEIELKRALEEARGARVELIAQVKSAFYTVLTVEESLEVLEASYANAMETAQNIENMYEQGLTSEYDMLRSQVAVRNLLPTIEQTRSGLELAKMQLKVLLSLELGVDLELEGELSQFREEIERGHLALGSSLIHNSTLRTLDLQLEGLHKTFQLVRSQRLPMLAGFASYQLQSQNEKFALDEKWANSVALGLSLQIPIFNRLSISTKEKQTEIGIRQLSLQRELLEDNLKLMMKNSLNEMGRARVQFKSDELAIEQATKGYEIAKVRYNTGAATLLELNDTEMALTTSRLNLNQTLFDYIKAKIEYEKLLGEEYL